MKILLINQEFPPSEGGAANASCHLARSLSGAGHAVTVLTARMPGVKRTGMPCRVEEVDVASYRGGAFAPSQLVAFARGALARSRALMTEGRPDVVHAFFTLPAGWTALQLNRSDGIPFVVSLRGSDVPGFRTGRGRWWYSAVRPVLRRVWNRAAAVVANSASLRDLAAQSWTGPIEVVPNGVDARRFQPSPRSAAASRETLRILMVNQLILRKRVERMIEALPDLAARCAAPVELHIVGRGAHETALRALADHTGGRAVFLGHLPPDAMPAIYGDADVFVLLSKREGMSNALLEAMAAGLPCVVATEASCALVRDGATGLVVDPDKTDWWCSLANLLADEDARRRLGEAARAFVIEHHAWEGAARAYERIYSRAVDGAAAAVGRHV